MAAQTCKPSTWKLRQENGELFSSQPYPVNNAIQTDGLRDPFILRPCDLTLMDPAPCS